MSILPDHQIAAISASRKIVDPFDHKLVQPASYDVLLDSKLLVPLTMSTPLDMRRNDKPAVNEIVMDEGGYILRPNRMVLGSTIECVDIPPTLVGRVEGKSTLARVGIQIHSAGYIDPGFRGNVTLEIVNFWPRPFVLWPGMRIAQLSFGHLSSRCQTPYSKQRNHYQDSEGVIEARYGERLS